MSARAIATEQGAGRMRIVGWFLELLDALGLQAFGTLCDGELHRFAFGERSVSFRLDGGVMDENIISGSALDESIALRVVEPLHDTLFSLHIVSVFLCLFKFNLFSSRNRSPKTAKAAKSLVLRPPTDVAFGHKN
jgi:hypothetical protein